MNTFFSDWYYLSIRNIKQIWRPWMALLPSFFMPLFFFGFNAASFDSVSLIPGFPAGSYLAFIAPTAVFTAAYFPAGNVGIELVLDMSNGYFKKLMISPISRLAIIMGRLSESAFQVLLVGLPVLLVVMLLGVKVQTGFWGAVLMFIILMFFAMGWGCISLILALLTQNPRMVQSMFMIAFPLLYLTTSQMPLELLPSGFRTFVQYNPFTYVLESVRSLMIRGWGDPAILQGLGVAIATFVIMLGFTLLAFRRTVK